MNFLRILSILVVVLTFAIAGCNGSGVTPPIPGDADLTLLVANSLGETLSVVQRTDGVWSVQKDILPTGQGANDIIVDGDAAYIICSLSNSIHVVDTKTMQTVREISTGEGTNPFAGAMDDDGNLWVTLTLTNQVIKVDPEASEPIQLTIDLPDESMFHHFMMEPKNSPWPESICFSEGKVYIAFANLNASWVAGGKGSVGIVDTAGGTFEELLMLEGMNTQGVVAAEDGKIYCISSGMFSMVTFNYEGNGFVEVYDPSTGTITGSLPLYGAPTEMVIGNTGAAYLTDGMGSGILRFDSSSLTPWPSIAIPDSGMGMNYVSGISRLGGDEIAVLEFNGNKLYVVDGITGDVLQSLDVGHGPDALALI